MLCDFCSAIDERRIVQRGAQFRRLVERQLGVSTSSITVSVSACAHLAKVKPQFFALRARLPQLLGNFVGMLKREVEG
jgi:hypothetical protein